MNASYASVDATSGYRMPTLSPTENMLCKTTEFLQQNWLEMPMLVLGFTWLALLVIELIWGLTPLLKVAGIAIWIIFILDFALRSPLAHKLTISNG